MVTAEVAVFHLPRVIEHVVGGVAQQIGDRPFAQRLVLGRHWRMASTKRSRWNAGGRACGEAGSSKSVGDLDALGEVLAFDDENVADDLVAARGRRRARRAGVPRKRARPRRRTLPRRRAAARARRSKVASSTASRSSSEGANEMPQKSVEPVPVSARRRASVCVASSAPRPARCATAHVARHVRRSFATASSSDFPLRSSPGQSPAIGHPALALGCFLDQHAQLFRHFSISTLTELTMLDEDTGAVTGESLTKTSMDGWLTWDSRPSIAPSATAPRRGTSLLDGRRRRALRVTLILDPDRRARRVGPISQPPMTDNFRRPTASSCAGTTSCRSPSSRIGGRAADSDLRGARAGLDRDVFGALDARVLAISDLVHVETLALSNELARAQAKATAAETDPAGVALLERYAGQIEELS